MLEGVWEAAAAAEVKPSAWASKGTSGRKLIRHVVYSFFTGIRRPYLLEFTPRGGVNLSGRAHTSWLFSCTLFTFNHAWFWRYDKIIIWYIAFELWSILNGYRVVILNLWKKPKLKSLQPVFGNLYPVSVRLQLCGEGGHGKFSIFILRFRKNQHRLIFINAKLYTEGTRTSWHFAHLQKIHLKVFE